jgi:hypothetical protein
MPFAMKAFVKKTDRLFDSLYHYWEGPKNQKFIGAALVVVYLLALLVVFIKRETHFFDGWSIYIPDNYFSAISLAFIFLLAVEIISLVFVLSQSITRSLIKQFEILSLILLRSAFKEFGNLSDILRWDDVNGPIYHIFSDAFGALIIFLVVITISRIKKTDNITKNEEEQASFISMKKLIALIMLTTFIVLGAVEFSKGFFFGISPNFFYHFYTILIFSDILIVLISLRYNYTYLVLFRNSAFALATVIIRLALESPPYYNVILGMISGLFTLGIVLIYSRLYRKPEFL